MVDDGQTLGARRLDEHASLGRAELTRVQRVGDPRAAAEHGRAGGITC